PQHVYERQEGKPLYAQLAQNCLFRINNWMLTRKIHLLVQKHEIGGNETSLASSREKAKTRSRVQASRGYTVGDLPLLKFILGAVRLPLAIIVISYEVVRCLYIRSFVIKDIFGSPQDEKELSEVNTHFVVVLSSSNVEQLFILLATPWPLLYMPPQLLVQLLPKTMTNTFNLIVPDDIIIEAMIKGILLGPAA
ncbi:hypothetical protein ACJX0J_037415, partial [Zea mays]